MVGRCGECGPRYRRAQLARQLGDRGNLRKRERLTERRSRLALESLELTVCRDQASGTIQAP
jgi:hypothetical protein